jgi:acetyl esterase/lipase
VPRPTRRAVACVSAGAALLAFMLWIYFPEDRGGWVYANPQGEPLTLHLDYPALHDPHCPVVLFAPHRGDWGAVDKRETRFRTLIDGLNRHGYAVATAHYRLLGAYHFPAQIEDGKAAVAWLRANGDRLGLATERIGAVGVSAGGYGVCMLGTTGPGDGFDSPGDSPANTRVQAVAALGAPTDLAARTWPLGTEQIFIRPFIGVGYNQDPSLYARASPITYVTPDDPPFLLFHSTDDIIVPVDQARSFAGKLRQVGVPVELIEEQGVQHIWGGERLDRAIDQLAGFFDKHIRP